MSAPDRLTVLTTDGRDRGKLATKRITRDASSEWQIEDYGQATWWSVQQIEVHDLVSLGQALASLEGRACSCIIRGAPLEAVDLSCCRRLKDAAEDGTPPSFAPTPRQWFGIDFDSVPMPIWDTERLASRREAILRDRAEQHEPAAWPDDPAEVIEPDLAGDLDPEPINPAKDWAISSARQWSPCRPNSTMHPATGS